MLLQIVMTRGKEAVLSEKHLRAGFGTTLVTSFSHVIESNERSGDFEGFAAEVQRVWDAKWAEVFSADAEGKGSQHTRGRGG
jgi:hypothetical protein